MHLPLSCLSSGSYWRMTPPKQTGNLERTKEAGHRMQGAGNPAQESDHEESQNNGGENVLGWQVLWIKEGNQSKLKGVNRLWMICLQQNGIYNIYIWHVLLSWEEILWIKYKNKQTTNSKNCVLLEGTQIRHIWILGWIYYVRPVHCDSRKVQRTLSSPKQWGNHLLR